MTEVSLTSSHVQPPEPAGLTARPPLTLAEEHVLLLWQVTASAEKLLAETEHGRWPAGELAALAGYAQAEVLRQVSDEEALLFPAVPAQTVAGLARDHVRLRAAAEMLARAAAGEQPMSPAQLAAAVRDFVTQLERHLRNEDDLLTSRRAPQDVPGTVTLGGNPHECYPLTEGPVVDVDALPADQAVAAAVDRLLRMRHGEHLELQSGTGLDPVWREISELSPGGYRFAVLQDGPTRWRMQVTRRQAAILPSARRVFRDCTITAARATGRARKSRLRHSREETSMAIAIRMAQTTRGRPAGQRRRDGCGWAAARRVSWP